jgi:hypothetical protein
MVTVTGSIGFFETVAAAAEYGIAARHSMASIIDTDMRLPFMVLLS